MAAATSGHNNDPDQQPQQQPRRRKRPRGRATLGGAVEEFLLGGVSTAVAVLFTNPFDTIKGRSVVVCPRRIDWTGGGKQPASLVD